jgi:hypothetical protein
MLVPLEERSPNKDQVVSDTGDSVYEVDAT